MGLVPVRVSVRFSVRVRVTGTVGLAWARARVMRPVMVMAVVIFIS